MRIEQLKIFKEVAGCQSISAAAEKLYTNQSKLSHAIQNLEKELGVKLIVRKSHGIALSEAGRNLLPIIDSIIEKSDYLLNYSNLSANPQKHFFINLTPQTTYIFFKYIYQPLKAIYPDIFFHFSEAPAPVLINNLVKNKANLAVALCNKKSISYKMTLSKHNNLTFETLFETQMAAAFNSHNPLAQNPSIPKNQLIETHMLLLDGVLRPNNTGTINPSENLSYYKHIDSFPNYQAIFEILENDTSSAAIMPIFLSETALFQSGLLKAALLEPFDEHHLTAYVLYHKNEQNPIMHTTLELLKAMKMSKNPL